MQRHSSFLAFVWAWAFFWPAFVVLCSFLTSGAMDQYAWKFELVVAGSPFFVLAVCAHAGIALSKGRIYGAAVSALVLMIVGAVLVWGVGLYLYATYHGGGANIGWAFLVETSPVWLLMLGAVGAWIDYASSRGDDSDWFRPHG